MNSYLFVWWLRWYFWWFNWLIRHIWTQSLENTRQICTFLFTSYENNMRYLKQSILGILLWSLLLFLIASYFPWLWFVVKSDYDTIVVIFFFLGIVSWFFNVLVKGVLKLITFPLSALSLWFFWFILNFLLLYVFEQFVNFLDLGVNVHLGNVLQVFVLSCILSFLYLLLTKIK